MNRMRDFEIWLLEKLPDGLAVILIVAIRLFAGFGNMIYRIVFSDAMIILITALFITTLFFAAMILAIPVGYFVTQTYGYIPLYQSNPETDIAYFWAVGAMIFIFICVVNYCIWIMLSSLIGVTKDTLKDYPIRKK